MLGTEGELGDVLRAAVLVYHDDVVLPGETELGGHDLQHVASSHYCDNTWQGLDTRALKAHVKNREPTCSLQLRVGHQVS